MTSARVLVLPRGVSLQEPTSFLKLPHPRLGTPALFLLDTNHQLFEVQAVTPTENAKRSWFVGDSIVQDGRLFVLTPFDPLFLLLHILLAASAPIVSGGQPRSLPRSEIFEEASNLIKFEIDQDEDEEEPAGADVVTFGQIPRVQSLIPDICEVQDVAQDLQTYRLCYTKTCQKLHATVDRLAQEELYDGTFPSLHRALVHDALHDANADAALRLQGRQSAALDVLGNYLPAIVEKKLRASYDFSLLDAHLEATRAAQALAEKQFRPKESSGHHKDTDKNAKNKKKKPPETSRGVKELEKASKRGMKPLTSFFGKK